MNHIDRLLRRALAQPRDAAKPLFDPFEQTAPLALDAPAPLHVARAAEHQVVEASPASTPAEARQSMPPSTAPPHGPGSPVASPAPGKPLESDSTPAVSLPTPRTAAPRAAASPLSRADAFMRTLGARVADVLPPADDAMASPVQAVDPSLPPRPRHAQPPAPVPRQPALARPPMPARANAVARAPALARAPAPAASPATAPRAAVAAPVERIVERTVVVSGSTSHLDDLASAGRIVRFGIGQG